jgi:site-specific DNA-methyltransferase (adenine-specific)
MSKIELFNEDCMIGMKRFPDKYFDLAIVDPPYGIERFTKNVESKTRKTFTNKLNQWDKKPTKNFFDELFRVSKNQIIWGANHFWKVDAEFTLPNCPHFIFWDKKQPVKNFAAGELAWTSFSGVARRIEYTYYGSLDGNKTGEKRTHPTQKPIQLYKILLKDYANLNDKILDTHLGSGSIAIACHEFEYDLTGFEIDKDYFDAASKRLSQHQSQLKLI